MSRLFRLTAALAILALGWLPAGRLDATGPRGVEVVTIVDASGNEVGLYEASHALVIGIADYTAGWPDLPGVRGDVEAVSRILEEHGFKVRQEADLDRQALDSVIREFIAERGQTPEARLVIYFAGHGHTLELEDDREMGFVVPADAPLPDRDRTGFVTLALPMDQVEVYAKTIRSKHALFLFDSCFSGSIFDLQRSAPRHISSRTARPVRQFITSGSADETVPDESVFRRQLVEALEGEGDANGDGYVTGAELGEFLYDKVVNYSRGTQHPQYGKIRHPRLDKGDFVFRLPAPSVLVVEPPPGTRFSLEDLESRAAWGGRLQEMKTAFERAQSFEQQEGAASLKAEAWRRFLSAFGEDDPFSKEDEALKKRAVERLAHWQRQAATPSPGDGWTEPGIGMRFRYVPAGTFQMGSPESEKERSDDEKPHTVTLTRGFWMGETEVTQGQWRQLMGNNPSYFQDCGEACPVEQVSWRDAVAFANRLSEEAGFETCYELECLGTPGTEEHTCESARLRGVGCTGFRLATEAEWERAARAESSTATYAGDLTHRGTCDLPELEEIAWYCGNSEKTTHPVGGKRANDWGLEDMLGNVWEWVEDAAELAGGRVVTSTYHGAAEDPLSLRGSERMFRGGSWSGRAIYVRSARRRAVSPGLRVYDLGFRLARDQGEYGAAGQPASIAVEAPTATPAMVEPTPQEPFTRVTEISWRPLPGGMRLTVAADGAIPQGSYRYFRLEGGSPREVIKLFGVRQAFAKSALQVGGPGVERIRVGYHPGNELHIILDLTDPRARIREVRQVSSGLEVDIEAPE